MVRARKDLRFNNRCLDESRIEEPEFSSKGTFRVRAIEMAELEMELVESFRPLWEVKDVL